MIFGFAPFTFTHIAISLLGIGSGVIVLWGLLSARLLERWTAVFLLSTILTSATGFFFPFFQLLPSHIIGIVSLGVLAVAVVARYIKRLTGSWRWLYAAGAVTALYLNVFVLIVQLFRRVPVLFEAAPTQSEPPFAIVQGAVFLAFAVLAVLAAKRFHPELPAKA